MITIRPRAYVSHPVGRIRVLSRSSSCSCRALCGAGARLLTTHWRSTVSAYASAGSPCYQRINTGRYAELLWFVRGCTAICGSTDIYQVRRWVLVAEYKKFFNCSHEGEGNSLHWCYMSQLAHGLLLTCGVSLKELYHNLVTKHSCKCINVWH